MSTKKYKSVNSDKKEEKNSVGKEILSWIEVFVIAAAIAFVINRFLIANSVVPTGSMEPNIMSGSRVFGSRLAYLSSDPERGDVVIFHWPDNEKIYFVKRVIGLPGETVDIIQGQVYINGEPDDVLFYLGLKGACTAKTMKEKAMTGLSEEEKQILKAMGPEPMHVEDIAARAGLELSYTIHLVSMLELHGNLRAHGTAYFSKIYR